MNLGLIIVAVVGAIVLPLLLLILTEWAYGPDSLTDW